MLPGLLHTTAADRFCAAKSRRAARWFHRDDTKLMSGTVRVAQDDFDRA
jgi:hypothetical protein